MPTTTTAVRRLIAVCVLAVLGWTFACRPTWSPDGKQLVYPIQHGQQVLLGHYDVATGRARVFYQPDSNVKSATAGWWSDDGKHVWILSFSNENRKAVQVTRQPVAGGEPTSVLVETGEEAVNHMTVPPVVIDGALFLGGKRLHRVDLESDERVVASEADEIEYWLARRGDEVCYVARTDKDDPTRWEFGVVDRKTLVRTPEFAAPADCDWEVLPIPAFDQKGSRIALPAQRGEPGEREAAILVFDAGELIHTHRIEGKNAYVSTVQWAPDDVTLITIVSSDTDTGPALALLEATFSGGFERRTPLLTANGLGPRQRTSGTEKLLPMILQPSLSPDGTMVALSTAFASELSPDKHGLLLVDRSGRQRTVKLVPFPKPELR